MRGQRLESTRGLSVTEVYDSMKRIDPRKELISISRLAIV